MEQAQGSLLIAGTSHVGKTTFAAKLANTLGWHLDSTDRLARHPGRPWPAPPPAVMEFYTSLSSETIHWFLKVHHENMRPLLQRRIEDMHRTHRGFILEGSALRPEYIADLAPASAVSIFLHAEAGFLRERICREADYDHADAHTRTAIDRFIERSLRDNVELEAAARRHGMKRVNVADRNALDGLYEELLQRFADENNAQ